MKRCPVQGMGERTLLDNVVKEKVVSIALNEFPVVDKDQSISIALKLMSKFGLDRVLVSDNGEIIGIVTKKDLLDKLLVERTRRTTASRMHVSSFMSTPLITIEGDESIGTAAKLMSEKNISSILVIIDGKVSGLITKREFLKVFTGVKDISVDKIMSAVVYIAKVGDRLLHIRNLMMEHNVYYFPIIDYKKQIVGSISIEEIADAFIYFHEHVPEKHRKEKRQNIFVEDVMKRPPIIVGLDTSIGDLASKLLSERQRGAIVVHENEIRGIVTLDSFVEFIVKYST